MREREEKLYQQLKNRLDWWSRLRLNSTDDLAFIDSKIRTQAYNLFCGFGPVGKLYLCMLENPEETESKDFPFIDSLEQLFLDSNAIPISVVLSGIDGNNVDYQMYRHFERLFSDCEEDLKNFFKEIIDRDANNPCKEFLEKM